MASGFDTKAIDKLLKKLDNYSNIETKEAVEHVAEVMEKAIYNNAPVDSGDGRSCIDICEVREYPSATYVDVGLRSDHIPFDKWKSIWFQNWGYNFKGTGKQITKHVGWFNNAVESKNKEVIKYLKDKLKEQEKEFKK